MYHDIDVPFTISVAINFVLIMGLLLAYYTNGQLMRKYDALSWENRKLRREVYELEANAKDKKSNW